MNSEGAGAVLVHVTEVDAGVSRQISAQERLTDKLKQREADLSAAIGMATRIMRDSISEAPQSAVPVDGWQVSELQATFGLTLTAEAGVLVSRAGAEATFEITIKVVRK